MNSSFEEEVKFITRYKDSSRYRKSGNLLCIHCDNPATKYILISDTYRMLCDFHHDEMLKLLDAKNIVSSDDTTHLSFFCWSGN